jgi:LPXTG-motif cell wall-anchored protein
LQEHENAVPEQLGIKEIHIIGYKYTKGKYKGCEVKFRQDIIKNIITKTSEGIKNGDITSDYKKLLSMRPFKPNTTRVWTKGKWLYLRCDWTIPTPKPTQSTSSPSESIAPSDSPSESIEPSTEPSVDSTVNPTNNVVYGNNSLPKTGESENVALIIAGILVIIAGIFTIVKICKPNN